MNKIVLEGKTFEVGGYYEYHDGIYKIIEFINKEFMKVKRMDNIISKWDTDFLLKDTPVNYMNSPLWKKLEGINE